jgi:hypothetical protein
MRLVPRLTVSLETARIDFLFKKVENPRQQAGGEASDYYGHDKIT